MQRRHILRFSLLWLVVLVGLAFTYAVCAAEADLKRPIQLVAVQMGLDINDYWTRAAFEAKMRGLMEQVAQRIDRSLPTLVVFPEDVGLMLVAQGLQDRVGHVTSVAQAIEAAVRANGLAVAITAWWHKLPWVPALYLHRHEIIAKTYFEVFSQLAKEYGVYLVAGSVALPPYRIVNGVVDWRSGFLAPRIHNTSYLFGPDGKVIGKQDKVYLIDLEKDGALHLSHGSLDSLRVFDTELGKIGIAICLDAFKDDVVAALAAQGAQILVQPSANPGPWSRAQQVDWMLSSYRKTYAERRFVYAINPMMHGRLWDIAFYGQSSIVAREPGGVSGLGYAAVGPAPGFISVAASDDREEILVVRVEHPDLVK